MSDYNPPSYIEMARLQTDEEAARRRQQQAQQLMQAGYNPVPNANPILSILASVMSTVKGDSMLKDSDAKMSEILAKRFELQNREDQAKAEAEQRRREEDWNRELQRIEITAQTGAKYREPRNIDPNSPEGIAARLQFERGKTGMQPQAAPAIPEYQKIIDAARAQGIQLSPEELKQVVTGLKPDAGAKPKELTGEAKNKLALLDNAIANAKAYKQRTVDVGGEKFSDIAANFNDTPQLMKTAVQDMLYAKSGATAPPEEVAKAEAMYAPAPSLKVPILGLPTGIPQEQDTTAAAKIDNFIRDMERLRAGITGDSPAEGASAPPSNRAAPSFDQWITAARAQNPGTSDQELKAFYAQKYGAS